MSTPTPDPPPAAPLTAEQIATKRAYAERVYSYPRTVDEPFYVCRDAVRLADECTALRDRLARAEERERALRELAMAWRDAYGTYAWTNLQQQEVTPKMWIALHQASVDLHDALAPPTDGAARAGDAAGDGGGAT